MLVVRKSRIPNAGRGLFTTSPIRKGDVIVEYLGDKLTWKQVLKRYKANLDDVRYVFCITDDNCIDAKPRKDELAQYANDANGGGKGGPFKNNCEYHIKKKRPYIVAIKNIPANSEILVDYGDEYWEALAENAEDEKLKQQKKKKGEIRIPREVTPEKKGTGKKKKAGKKAAGGRRK
ncbi:MAG: SET domain-containing protein [Bacteroidota bacterium]|nr:SET domain-containing protein [Bacteroidota bacterium]